MEEPISIYLLTSESVPFLMETGMTQLKAHLRARSKLGRVVMLVYPPFYKHSVINIMERILHAESLAARLRMRPSVEKWFKDDVEPLLMASGSRFRLDTIDYPPTASLSHWERFFTKCIQNFTESLARELGGECWVRSPARLILSTGNTEWALPTGMPDEKLRLVLVSGALLTHAHESDLRAHIGLPHTTLLPPHDHQVLSLLTAAYPQAQFFCFGTHRELRPDLERLFPSWISVESVLFAHKP